MLDPIKRALLRSLSELGYCLLKREEYERLIAAADRALMPEPAAGSPMPAVPTIAPDGPEQAACLAAAGTGVEIPVHAQMALYAVAQYVVAAGIPGGILDCGFGATGTLTTLALALKHLGDTHRQLVLFDTTASPLHRAETELELWGVERDLMTAQTLATTSRVELPPQELIATGYPQDKISIRRYPRDEIAAFGKFAFLGLTSQTYPANRDAIAAFYPSLSHGGVILVTTDPSQLSQGDAVEDYLRRAQSSLLFFQLSADRRLAVKP